MSVFKPRIPGVGSDRSANCATTTALTRVIYIWRKRLVPLAQILRLKYAKLGGTKALLSWRAY